MVERSTRNSKIGGSNLAANTEREKMTERYRCSKYKHTVQFFKFKPNLIILNRPFPADGRLAGSEPSNSRSMVQFFTTVLSSVNYRALLRILYNKYLFIYITFYMSYIKHILQK